MNIGQCSKCDSEVKISDFGKVFELSKPTFKTKMVCDCTESTSHTDALLWLKDDGYLLRMKSDISHASAINHWTINDKYTHYLEGKQDEA